MKSIIAALSLLMTFQGQAQVICETASEGGTVTLTVPAGATIISIDFASYGTPNGTCGSFTIGACNAANSVSIAQATFVGQQSASLAATNGVFGDPCGGTPKRLYVQATWSFPLPISVLSFIASETSNGASQLIWQTGEEINASRFIIERSSNGTMFVDVDSVPASNNGSHHYSFIDHSAASPAAIYYRLKMVDHDGKFSYTKILRFDRRAGQPSLVILPTLTSGDLTISSSKDQDAWIVNNFGQVVRMLRIAKGSQVISVSGFPAGLYVIKTPDATVKFLKG